MGSLEGRKELSPRISRISREKFVEFVAALLGLMQPVAL